MQRRYEGREDYEEDRDRDPRGWRDERPGYGGLSGSDMGGRGGYGRIPGQPRPGQMRGEAAFGGYSGREEGYGYGPENRGGRGRGDEGRGFFDRAGDEIASWFGDDEAERRRRADAPVDGNYRGQGPKGYARSDARILEDVSDRMSEDSRLDASDIEVGVKDGEVTLNGVVSDRAAKRRAEDLADGVTGVKHVQNNLRVRQAATASASALGTGGVRATGTGTQGVPDDQDAGNVARTTGDLGPGGSGAGSTLTGRNDTTGR
ncbi:MAG: BON domain-containing protein [Geminicoccaceae bacterium]|nr:BON domain-containing protein [Geminicoccaceae bacterium]